MEPTTSVERPVSTRRAFHLGGIGRVFSIAALIALGALFLLNPG